MKILLSVIGLLLSYSVFSQVQLDSIIVENEDSEELLQLDFVYEQGKLSKFTRWEEEEFDFDFEIEYDSENRISNLLFILWFDQFEMELFYKGNGVLDSIVRYYNGNIQHGKYTYVDDVKTQFSFFGNLSSQPAGETKRKTYTYEGNKVTETDSILIPQTKRVREFYYDNQDVLLKRTLRRENGFYAIDTFLYNETTLQSIDRKLNSDDEWGKGQDYDLETSINFDNILNPSEFILLLEDLTRHQYKEFYYPMVYGVKVNSSEGDYNTNFTLENERSTWYYSILSANSEQVPAVPLSIFPNPTTNYIQFNSTESINQYRIYDQSGKLIDMNQLNQNQIISVQNLPKGSFTITASTKSNQHFFGQFIKK